MKEAISDRLREIGLFAGLGDDLLRDLASSLTSKLVAPGEVVFREGESGRELFVLLDGEMEVSRKTPGGHECRMAILGPGDWFGEMSVLDVMPRSATIRALSHSSLLVMTGHDLDTLYRRDLKAYSLLVLNIARELSRRLRVADGLVARFLSSVVDEYTGHRLSR